MNLRTGLLNEQVDDLDRRALSADRAVEQQWGKYVAPKNFNFWYYFGSLARFVLVMQIVTGIFLTMNYKPDATQGVRVGRVHHARRASGAG